MRYLAGFAAILMLCGCPGDGEPGEPGSTEDIGGGDIGREVDADVPDSAPPACDDDTRRCSGDADVEICRGGQWLVLASCPGGQSCDGGECVEDPCEPACAEAVCGDDGCGGSCGTCDDPQVCVGGACEMPPPSCGDDVCDPDENCAICLADCACPAGESCDAETRACAPDCAPSCAEAECGGDGCGGSCGMCAGELVCVDGGCVEPPAECGDGICEDGETCLGCPVDCGVCCGDGACVADHGEDCATCLADCLCGEDERCDVRARACVPACTPQCDGRACGDNGCGGDCGLCPGGQVCDVDGACAEPPAECGDRVCDDGEDCANCPADCGQCCGNGVCAGGENCATCLLDCGCDDGEVCDLEARACAPEVCAPQCQGRVCGPDGCGGVCGICDDGDLCDPERGRCEQQCEPACAGRVCGPDGCGGACGACGPDEDCEAGQCVAECVPACDDRVCGDDGCGGECGACRADEDCDAGRCVPECAPLCQGRVCGDDGCGGSCGACEGDRLCNANGQCIGGGIACDCAEDELCLDGVCRQPELVCGAEVPNGLCGNGEDCVAGICVDAGAGCTVDNPGGICPAGELCVGGVCEPFDALALCDDRNPCTAEGFDFARNACVNPPVDAQCSDGNGCTIDRCEAGVCVSEPIGGCVEPPTLDPYVTPTNEVELNLSGTKPLGAAVTINGEVAAPESPEERWAVTLNLIPGENVYTVRSVDRGQESEAVEVRVVYDITPPTTIITPDGGVYLDGLTVTIATDEPATVYYTTDGSTPTADSDSFFSVRTMRVFDDTVIRVLARDEAGNWEETIVSATFEITGERNQWRGGAPLAELLIHPAVARTVDSTGIYVVGGSDGQAAQAGVAAYDAAEDAWVNLPALPLARAQAAAIDNGALYVFGGENEGVPLNLVSRLSGDAWENRRPMPSTRFGLRAVLSGGRVFVLGGKANGGAVVDTLEVYDINADTWTNDAAQMPRPRYAFTTALVGDQIYVIGGEDEEGTPIGEVDVYDIGDGAWSQIADLPTARSFLTASIEANAGRITGGHTGIVVSGGRVLGGQSTAVVEEYIVDEARWVTRTPMPTSRHGGGGATIVRTGDLDNVQTEGWVVGGQIGGDALAGGSLTETTVFYTHVQDHIRHLDPLPAGRFMHAAVSLGDRIYLLGGREFQETTEGWAFDPETGTYEAIAELPGAQNGLAAVAFQGRVWTIGGANAFGLALATLRSYDPVLDRWTEHRPMLNGRRDAVAAVIDGEIYAVGGDNNGAVQAVEIYDPIEDRWRNGPLLPEARSGAAGATWRGRLYVAGGRNADGTVRNTLLRLDDDRWFQLPLDGFQVADGDAVIVNDQLNVLGGRLENGAINNRHYTFDLATERLNQHWEPESRLLLERDHYAAAAHNGEVYIFGGNEGTPPGPNGQIEVQKFAGRCLDGVVGPYEGVGNNTPDLGGGCGNFVFNVALAANRCFAYNGSCGEWRDCGNAEGCADRACISEGLGPAVSWVSTNCPRAGLTCQLITGNRVTQPNHVGCNLPCASTVVCAPR